MKVCFIGCYSDWFLEGDIDQVELFAVTIGEFPEEVSKRFVRHVSVDMEDFGNKSGEWHLADKGPSLYHYLCAYMPECDHFYSFRTIIRVDDGMVTSLEVSSDQYCGGGVDARQPWTSFLLKHIFSDRVKHIDSMTLDRSTKTVRILIPSTIYTSSRRIDNSDNRRSIFTAEERFEQLLAQVRDLYHIRDELPPFEVFVLEGSRPRLTHLRQLSRYATVVLFYETKGEYYANEHPVKSYFEFYSVYRMLRFMRNYKWFIKFGARYRPIGDPIRPLLRSRPCGKIIPGKHTFTGQPIMNSVLFSYPYGSFTRYLLERLRNQLASDHNHESSESIFLHPTTEHIEQLSVYGWDGVYACVQVE